MAAEVTEEEGYIDKAKRLIKDLAERNAQKSRTACNLYILGESRADFCFFSVNTNSKKSDALEFVEWLNEYGTQADVFYNFSKHPAKLAVEVNYEKADITEGQRQSVEESESYGDDNDDNDNDQGPSTREPQCSSREVERMFDSLERVLFPLLEPREPMALRDVEMLAGTRHKIHSAIFVFPESRLRRGDLDKLRLIFKAHPDYKGKISLCWEDPKDRDSYKVPFPWFLPKGKQQVDVESFQRSFLALKGYRAPTVDLSAEAQRLYRQSLDLVKKGETRRNVQTNFQEREHGCPLTPDSIIDLENPNYPSKGKLTAIFDPDNPDLAIQYMNMFFADVGKHVYVKKMHRFTKTPHLECVDKAQLKLTYSDWEKTLEREDEVSGKVVKKQVHMLDYYLKHQSHFSYENTAFKPGEPTVITTPIPGATHSDYYATDVRELNTCPKPTYTNYKDLYLRTVPVDDKDPGRGTKTVSLLDLGPRPPPKSHAPDFERSYFRRGVSDDGSPEPLIATFRRRMVDPRYHDGRLLPTSEDIPHSDRDRWEEQVKEEGADLMLWLIMFHTYFVLCKRDLPLFDRFHAFFARALFKPQGKDKQYLVISGKMGAGKTNLINCIGQHLFGLGTLYTYCGGDSERIVGRFTGQFENSVLVCVDESSFNKAESSIQNKLKTMCTDDLRTVEKKHQESKIIENFLHVVFITNDLFGMSVVDPGDRRYIFFEAEDELAIIEIYHKILQPRVSTRFFNMVYGRWLESNPDLLDNSKVNFFKAPPFTPAKERCVLANLVKSQPQYAWWHACVFYERHIRCLKASSFDFKPLMMLTKDIAWVNEMETHYRETTGKWVELKDFTAEQFEGIARKKATANPNSAAFQWAAQDDSPEWRILRGRYGEDDCQWPYRTTIKDLYNSFLESQGRNTSFMMQSTFSQWLRGVVTTAPIPEAPNQEDEPIKLPCLYACRAQFSYHLKYNGIKDKAQGLVTVHGPDYDAEYDAEPADVRPTKRRRTTGARQGGQGNQELSSRASAPGTSHRGDDTGARHGDDGDEEDVERAQETWVDLLWELIGEDNRKEGVHRYCKQCRGCSELWREVEQEHRAEDSRRFKAAPPAARQQGVARDGGQAETHGLCAADHERRSGERAVDTQDDEPVAKGKGRDDGGGQRAPLAGVQPGRAGLSAASRARVQDQSDEEDTAGDSDGDRPVSLSAGSNESPLLSSSWHSQMDTDIQRSTDGSVSPVLHNLRRGPNDERCSP
jgi:hypothetical protein